MPAMTHTHVAFEGGTKDGTTANYTEMESDSNLLFDLAFEKEELYERTNETRLVNGIEHIVYRLA